MTDEVRNNQSVLTQNQFNTVFSSEVLLNIVFRDRSFSVQNEVKELGNAVLLVNNSIKEISELLAATKANQGFVAADDDNSIAYTAAQIKIIKKYAIASVNYAGAISEEEVWAANASAIEGVLNELTNLSSQMSNRLKSLTDKHVNSEDSRKTNISENDKTKQETINKIG